MQAGTRSRLRMILCISLRYIGLKWAVLGHNVVVLVGSWQKWSTNPCGPRTREVRYNVFHHREGHPIERATFSWHCELHVRMTMPQPQNAILIQQEGRITLAVQAFRTGQFKSVRRAAAAYNVRHQQVSRRLRGITFRPNT